ncbi:hypothetical protein K501DRAFT_202807 [Backusella circina FSU 941]|nr:hypothetical protein K501DRAFT_202807 [Backusella circina FSU 941]
MLYDHEDFNFNQRSSEPRRWSERILEDITGIIYVLSPTTEILYCSKSCTELTGYQPYELIGKSLTDFIHVEDIDIFIHNYNIVFQSMERVKLLYRFRKKDTTYILLESVGETKRDIPNQPPQSFLAIAQPYLSRNNGLFDSFTELKAENEALKKRLNELLIIHGNSNSNTAQKRPLTLDMSLYSQAPLQPTQYDNSFLGSNLDCSPQMSPRRPSSCNSAIYQVNSAGDDTMSTPWTTSTANQYTSSVTSSIEFNDMLTKFQQEDLYTTLPEINIRNGPSYLSPTDSAVNPKDDTRKEKIKRRKKHRSIDKYVCTDCGTITSPEWRKGPHGPKTLCNACGLRWAKRIKKSDSNMD